jgi:hypothetical protein
MNTLTIQAAALFMATLTMCGCTTKETELPKGSDEAKIISLKIENGTSLAYKVTHKELVNYTFELTFRDLNPELSFDYFKTNMDYTKGSVEMEEPALRNSHTLLIDLAGGKSHLSDKTAMVLSREAYRDLLETGKVNLNLDYRRDDFFMDKNEEFRFEKGQASVVEKVMHCSNSDHSVHFWVWKNPELPLIMKYSGNGTTMELTYWYLPGEKN